MTITPERLAELDAVMAKATAGEWGADGVRDNRIVWSGPDTRVCFMAIYPKAHADSLAIVALHNVYPDLRAHIDAQAATIAEWRKALNMIARGTTFRSKGGAIIDVPLRDKDARNAVIAALKATGDA